MQLPEELLLIFPDNLDKKQISEEATEIISKVYRNEQLSEHDLDTLLNPTEVAALLSAKYRQTVNHRYIKEITRSFTNPKTGHVTPARLTYDRIAGRTHLYKTGKALDVKLRQKASSKGLQRERQNLQETSREFTGEAA